MAMFHAPDVLSATVLPQGRAGVWFLNWDIRAKPMPARATPEASAYAGPGIYGLCFDEQLIYIGSFLGKIKAGDPFGGDVVSSRWWTHICAITSRGSRLHLAPQSLQKLQEHLQPDHALLEGLLAANDPDLLHVDAGNLSPLRRLLFAAQHSADFFMGAVDPQQVLSRFSFVYERLDAQAGMQEQALKAVVIQAEKELIGRCAPTCNTGHLSAGTSAQAVHVSQLPALLRQVLDGQELPVPVADNPRVAPTPMDAACAEHAQRPSAVLDRLPPHSTAETVSALAEDPEAAFWRRLPPQISLAGALVDSLVGLALRNRVEVVYTATNSGDLRFKYTTPSGRSRVFMTVAWQPREQRFWIKCKCPAPQATHLLGPLALQESVCETASTEPQDSEIKVLAQANRLGPLHHVFLQAMAQAQMFD